MHKVDVYWELSHFEFINIMDFKHEQLFNIYIILMKIGTTLKFLNFFKELYISLKEKILNDKDKLFIASL